MKNHSYRLSCIKKDVYTFVFYFLRLSCSHYSHSLRHPSLGLTLPLRKIPVFQSIAPRHTTFTLSCVIPLWDSATAHSPSSKELNSFSQEDSVFQGVAHRQTNFTLFCVIPLWESARAHSPSGKYLILSSLEKSCFSGLIVLLMFSHYPAWAHFGLLHTHIFH